MRTPKFQDLLRDMLSSAGIAVDGPHPWDPQIHRPEFYRRVLAEGSLGLGGSYMDGWWDCERVDEFIARILRARLDRKVPRGRAALLHLLLARAINLQSKRRAFHVGEEHYDLGNDLFQTMLDGRMAYSCGYWKAARTLDEAQEAKLELICRKLHLAAGMKVLDVGCGWGSFARYAAEKHGAHVVGITVSKEQETLGKVLCQGLPVEIRVQDYRDVHERYDRIVSIGMFEHVGCKNYRRFMQAMHRCLADDGLFLLHTIGSNETLPTADRWITKYIFPNGVIPSVKQIGGAMERLFVMEDWHNFGTDYDKTLLAWHAKFEASWDKIKPRYGERFYRMWTYYLLSCAGAFRARCLQLWQLVLSKEGVQSGYASPR